MRRLIAESVYAALRLLGALLSEAADRLRDAHLVPPLYAAAPQDPDRIDRWAGIATPARMYEGAE